MTTAHPHPARPGARRRPAPGARVAADALPVARVLVEIPLPHLDRPFDYLVDKRDDAQAQPGVRVRVRFAGRQVGGYVLARVAESEHSGQLEFIQRVVSPEPVLTAEVAELARAVADRYAGTVADVLRMAVPPRHARVEKQLAEAAPAVRPVATPVADPPAAAPCADEPAVGRAAVRSAVAPAAGVGKPAEPVPADRRATTQLAGGDTMTPPPARAGTLPRPVAPRRAADPASGSARGSLEPGSGNHRPHVPAVPLAWSSDYPAGPAFFRAIRAGRPARAVWQALPGEDWPTRLAEAAAAAQAAGRGALLIVPDVTDLARLDAALTTLLGTDRHVTLTADLGPAERYRRFLAVRRGERTVVAGTRAAAFAPVADLGLVAVFDDGDDLLAEPRAPYPHVREVLMLRSVARSCAMLIAGFARTAEAQLLLDSAWAHALSPQRPLIRSRSPWIRATDADHAPGATSAAAHARIPPVAFDAARGALADGAPVLVQVPRAGYVPAVACDACRRPARCRRCRGPLRLAGPEAPLLQCRWCGKNEGAFCCGACGGDRIRATTIGIRRTAEEIGRAFPGVPILTSSSATGRPVVPDGPAIVVATPGAEPVAPTGYGAALLLDGWSLLGRPDLRAAEETLRRWLGAAALVRSTRQRGQVVVAAEASLPTVQALIRWDPAGHAEAELGARRDLGFPPAVAVASIDGTQAAIVDALDRLVLPVEAEILGPVPVDDADVDDPAEVERPGALPLGAPSDDRDATRLRALVRVPLTRRRELSGALRTLAAARSARKLGGGLWIRVDPAELV